MKWVKQEVYLVAQTRECGLGIESYLRSLPTKWWPDAPEGEALVEIGGRLCYRSFDPSLNKNLTKVREGNAAYIANIVKQRHGSVLEHTSATFIFRNVSRVFTHELVRHRAGCAISQESLRYVALDDIPLVSLNLLFEDTNLLPEDRPLLEAEAGEVVRSMEAFITKWRKIFIGPNTPMARKKEVTSLLRRLAPIGLATSIMWTANLRALRHILELRTAPGAEAEIHLVFDQVGEILTRVFPATFADFTRDKDGVWTPKYSKV
jgi:thymidylate synthase (FAD)